MQLAHCLEELWKGGSRDFGFKVTQVAAPGFVTEGGDEQERGERGESDGSGGEPEGRHEGEGREQLCEDTSDFAASSDPPRGTATLADLEAFRGVGHEDRDDRAGSDDEERDGHERVRE